MSPKTILIAIFVFAVLIEIMYYRKTKHPFRNAFVGIISGVAVLVPTSFVLAHFGVILSINYITLMTAAVLGIPGVAAMGTLLMLSI